MAFDKTQVLQKINEYITKELPKANDKVLALAIFLAQWDEDSEEFITARSIIRLYIKDEFGKRPAENFTSYVDGKLHKLQRAYADLPKVETKAEIIEPIIDKAIDDERLQYDAVVLDTIPSNIEIDTEEEIIEEIIEKPTTESVKVIEKTDVKKPQPKKRPQPKRK